MNIEQENKDKEKDKLGASLFPSTPTSAEEINSGIPNLSVHKWQV